MEKKIINLIIKLSKKAYNKGEIPVGAVIVNNNKIVSKGFNNRQKKYSLIGHAEINAILKAEKKIKDWRLDTCDMYVTLFPCEMCQLFIKESRIKNVFYLCDNIKSHINLKNYKKLNYKNKEYEELLTNFFKELRK